MRIRKSLLLCVLPFAIVGLAKSQTQHPKVEKLKITVLSTMVAGATGVGEWGFCALVEFDGRKILFDTGSKPETVLNNSREMNIDLSDVTEVFISHGHNDHTGGLITLRRELSLKNPKALSVAHIGEGAFYPRPSYPDYNEFLKNLQSEYEATGGQFIVYKNYKNLYPGVWNSGPVPRKNDEKNWSGSGLVKLPNGTEVEDNVPEDQSLVFNTKDGLVILSGCGHAGVINTIEYARTFVEPAPVNTLIGGFHLFNQPDEKLAWTAQKLKNYGMRNLLAAHCTGIQPVYAIRKDLSLGKNNAIVGGVGAVFELGKEMNAGPIAN